MLNLDDIHFVVAKKKSQFWIKALVCPFICNTRLEREEVDMILKEMKFNLSFTLSYDPWGIISKLRVENKTTPYIHTSRPEIEKYVNRSEWVENTLQEVEEQLFSTSNLQNLFPQVKVSKRQREKGSSSIIGSEAKEFITGREQT